jgi:RNA polymerase sigma-70 factor (ECF subfamily)
MTPAEQDLLHSARTGDEEAFNRLVAPLRTELQAHCYRMLGSATDAEDAVQEALLGAWRGLGRFEGRSSVRTWMYRIATNACLKTIQRRPKRMLPVDYGPSADPHDSLDNRLTESVWVLPLPTENVDLDQRETVGLAFVAALQHLPARQRAVLLMCDVLGYSGSETAELLEMTATSVYSSLQRARATVQEKLSGRNRWDDGVGDLDYRRLGPAAARFVDAWQRGDVELLVGMLTEDATFSMPPIPNWLRGRSAIAEFLASRPMSPGLRWRVVPTEANTQPAFAFYLFDESKSRYLAHSITLLEIREGLISAFDAFLFPDLFALFDLPAELPSGAE